MKKHDSTTDAATFLTAVGIDPKAAAKVETKPGIDPHTLPIDQIVFTVDMLDKFDDLSDRAPADYLFKQFKSPHKDPNRNGMLWRKVTSFISDVRRARQAGETGAVKEKIASTKGQRDLAAHLAALGLDGDDLPEIVKALKAAAEAKEAKNV